MLRDFLKDEGYPVSEAENGEIALIKLREDCFDLVLTDYKMPGMDGMALLQAAKDLNPEVDVVVMTAFGTVETAVSAMKAGASDYISKPIDLDELQLLIERISGRRTIVRENKMLRKELRGKEITPEQIIFRSAAMAEVINLAGRVAKSRATVLIQGESGTGKELIARLIHDLSPRFGKPMTVVNCAALPENLLESELFGHEKGAFTGAMNRHQGAFERAHDGTLFLDEIGIAPPSVQARLLRVLETREFMRVGGNEPIAVDVRIISATNRNPDDLVAEKLFRQDLLYRLQVVTLRIPPLRERHDDIRPLTDHFIATACAEYGRHIESVEPACYEILERYPWPGNVRELKNAMETAVIMATAPVLKPADLHLGNAGAPGGASVIPASMPLEALEKQAILQSLQRHKGSRTLASEELGVSLRTIQRKIKEYNLPF